MTDGLAPSCEHLEGCITCGDEAVEMTILRIDRERDLALCGLASDPAKHESVEIALVHPVAEGDSILVHAATAIARIDSEVAA
jgi:hydrogenase maturation factor